MKRILPTFATIGSHSALDVCFGAKQEGFSTLVIAQKGREKTYTTYYASKNGLGCVDECLLVNKFSDIFSLQNKLQEKNCIFIPNRSFEAYLQFDYERIEQTFNIPMFGNKYLLKIEERERYPNQYDLLEKANIAYPKQFTNPKKIDRLCLVKVLEAERGFERAFFLVNSPEEYKKRSQELLDKRVITKQALQHAVIEEYVVGVQINFNFFYSPLTQELELLGTDTRRQTNYEGYGNLPAFLQEQIADTVAIKFEEAGHIAVTVLESLLEPAFEYADRFVTATKKFAAPGIIGPFSLQTIITPGPPKKKIYVIDVSPRMPGSPGIAATPYSAYLFGEPISVGQRIAKEVKAAISQNKLSDILT